MKTRQEILDFFGVEVGKKYRITKTVFKEMEGVIFEIVNNVHYFSDVEKPVDDLYFKYNDFDALFPLTLLANCDYEEDKPILDDVEREYLQKYVMNNPAFKGKVKSITKGGSYNCELEYLYINSTNNHVCSLPWFKANSMYKNMKLNKQYTPQELGLEE